jgi:hypothetical protein
MIDFVFILEGRVLWSDELGRPSKHRHNRCADGKEAAHRDNEAGDNTEREIPGDHVPRVDGVTDVEPE